MIGFIVSGGCALALVLLARSRRGLGRPWGRMGLYRVFQRLATTPGQEQVIRSALLKVKEAGRSFAEEAKSSRPEMAEMLRGEHLEEAGLRAWFAARERSVDDAKPVAISALKEIHEVLDPSQRKKLGDWVETGPRAFFLGSSCSHHHHPRCGGAC